MPSTVDDKRPGGRASSVMDSLLEDIASMSTASAPAPAPSPQDLRPLLRPVTRLSTGSTAVLPSVQIRSPPLSATASLSGGAGIRGHVDGKKGLLLFENRIAQSWCAGYIGGPKGNRTRFCCEVVSPGLMQFCGDKHKGEKYPLRPNTYFIGMQKKSALCQPCISVEELTSCNALDLTTAEHSSKQWMQILTKLRARIDSRADLQRHANTEGSTVGYASAADHTLVDAPEDDGWDSEDDFQGSLAPSLRETPIAGPRPVDHYGHVSQFPSYVTTPIRTL